MPRGLGVQVRVTGRRVDPGGRSTEPADLLPPGWRLLRSIVLGCAPVGLAAAGHAAAGGVVGLTPLLLTCLAAWVAASVVLRGPLRLAPVVTMAAMSQLVGHLALSFGGSMAHGAMSTPSATAPAMTGPAMSAHAMATHATSAPDMTASDMSAHAEAGGALGAALGGALGGGLPMLGAHLAAAVLSAVVMLRCEELLLAGRDLLAHRLRRPEPRLRLPQPARRTLLVFLDQGVARAVARPTPLSRRGPPERPSLPRTLSPACNVVAVP